MSLLGEVVRFFFRLFGVDDFVGFLFLGFSSMFLFEAYSYIRRAKNSKSFPEKLPCIPTYLFSVSFFAAL